MYDEFELKCSPEYFKDICNGIKRFEVRKNDRDYKIGDRLILDEYSYENGGYSGECAIAKIIYILNDPDYCKDGYVILGIEGWYKDFLGYKSIPE